MRFTGGLNALFPLDWEQIENWRTGRSHAPRTATYNQHYVFFFSPLSYTDSSHNTKAEKFIYYIKAVFSLLIPAFLGGRCLAVSPAPLTPRGVV